MDSINNSERSGIVLAWILTCPCKERKIGADTGQSVSQQSMTGRRRALADLLKTESTQPALKKLNERVQEKSREIGDGYKLIYNGASNKRNGVATAVAARFRDKISLVERYLVYCESLSPLGIRLMAIKIHIRNITINVVTADAPQIWCSDGKKEEFWRELSDFVNANPRHESMLLGSDPSGYVRWYRDDAGDWQKREAVIKWVTVVDNTSIKNVIRKVIDTGNVSLWQETAC